MPTGAADGPIRVETFDTTIGSGAALGATPFLMPPPDCAPATGHTRSITLKLKKNGQASGVVKSTEDPPFTDCVSAVPVKIQRKAKGGGWKNAGTATTTDTGSYSKKTKGKPGKYRALAPKTTDPRGLCEGHVCDSDDQEVGPRTERLGKEEPAPS